MTTNTAQKERVAELADKLEQGVRDLFNSDHYKTYLNTMSKFHHYSFNNILLIAWQRPDASLVAGFHDWRKKFGRQVQKGEKGISILAPAFYKTYKYYDLIDPETGNPKMDENGKVMQAKVETTIPAYRIATVFDIKQTEGKPLPQLMLVNELNAKVDRYSLLMESVQSISPVPISYEDIPGGAKGYYHLTEKRIVIKKGMSELQSLKTALHESAHAILHSEPDNRLKGHLTASQRELEAESVAYVVSQYFGLDTSNYSFGYLAGWSIEDNTEQLKASLKIIQETSDHIISGMKEYLSKHPSLQHELPAIDHPKPHQENIPSQTPTSMIDPDIPSLNHPKKQVKRKARCR